MRDQGLARAVVKAGEGFSVALGEMIEEVLGQQHHVIARVPGVPASRPG
jgi:hypothetical protein